MFYVYVETGDTIRIYIKILAKLAIHNLGSVHYLQWNKIVFFRAYGSEDMNNHGLCIGTVYIYFMCLYVQYYLVDLPPRKMPLGNKIQAIFYEMP